VAGQEWRLLPQQGRSAEIEVMELKPAEGFARARSRVNNLSMCWSWLTHQCARPICYRYRDRAGHHSN